MKLPFATPEEIRPFGISQTMKQKLSIVFITLNRGSLGRFCMEPRKNSILLSIVAEVNNVNNVMPHTKTARRCAVLPKSWLNGAGH